MSRLRANGGFTLIEMLVAMTIGMVLSLVAFGLLDFTMKRTGDIAARIDTTQRGRAVMDQMTRELRSQVCVQRSDDATMLDDRQIYAATATSVTFFADLSDESVRAGSVAVNPQLRSLSLESGSLIERIWTGTYNNLPANPLYAYTGTPAVRTLLDHVAQYQPLPVAGVAQPVSPVFSYYGFDTTVAPATPTLVLTPGASGLTAAQLLQVTRIRITYRALPTRGGTAARGSTVFTDDVFARDTDPNIASPSPTCA